MGRMSLTWRATNTLTRTMRTRISNWRTFSMETKRWVSIDDWSNLLRLLEHYLLKLKGWSSLALRKKIFIEKCLLKPFYWKKTLFKEFNISVAGAFLKFQVVCTKTPKPSICVHKCFYYAGIKPVPFRAQLVLAWWPQLLG